MVLRSYSVLGILLPSIIIIVHHCPIDYLLFSLQYMGLYVFNWPISVRWLKGYIYSSCYYHHQIGIIHLSHCFLFFICYIIFCHLLQIQSGKTRKFVFIIIVQFMMSAYSRIRFALQIVLVCLYSTPSHDHHCANLSEDIELMKCLSDTFCRVCKIKHILSVTHYTIHYTICGTVWFQFTYSPCDDWDNIYIYILSYYHHQ